MKEVKSTTPIFLQICCYRKSCSQDLSVAPNIGSAPIKGLKLPMSSIAFDELFGYILEYGIDTADSYNKAKKYATSLDRLNTP
jgi:hypothetical protein